MTQPLDYPSEPYRQRHAPLGYLEFQAFKPWLRDKFCFRCAYCLTPEKWVPNGHEYFGIDHLIPRDKAPDRDCDYTNLVYVCNRCNSRKRDELILSPYSVSYADHLTVTEDGTMAALTATGEEQILMLGLNATSLIAFRRRMLMIHQLVDGAAESGIVAELEDLFRFPDDMPDLSRLRPPSGNTRPEGITESFFARRERGELPDTY